MITYIIKALQSDGSVFINDLGTFTTHYEPAKIDGDMLIPPCCKVTLTLQQDEPDETGFINFLSEEKQCMLTQAAKDISEWVDNLKNALQHNKSISFDNFGTFSITEKGTIRFVCDHIAELNHEFEGMEIVSLTKKDKQGKVAANVAPYPQPETQPQPEPEPEPEPEPQPQPEPEPEPEPVSMQEDAIKEEGKTSVPSKHRSLHWLFILTIIIAVSVLGFLFRHQIMDTVRRIQHKTAVPAEPATNENATDESEADYLSIEEEMTDETAAVASDPWSPETVKSTADGNYNYIRFETGHFYVIAGSLTNEKDAELHIRQKGLDAHSPYLLLQDNVSNIRVCIGIYDNEEEAEAFAKSINQHYWVLK